jgi:adenylate kinase
MDITVFLGAPGSGKGTQAKRLAQKAGFTHLSTGDMLRSAIQNQTPVGLKAKTFMDRGELVPDEIMIALIESSLSKGDVKRVLLDGFPRTVPQAEALDRNPTTAVARAVHFKVPQPVLVARLTGRRVCKNCGESYHVENLRPKVDGICDRCGGQLIQRSDDAEDVVKRRLEVFEGQNSKLLAYYERSGKLKHFNGDQPIEVFQQELLRTLQ